MPTAESVLNDALQLSPDEQEALLFNLESLVKQRSEATSDLLDQRMLPELRRRVGDLKTGRVQPVDFDDAAIANIMSDD